MRLKFRDKLILLVLVILIIAGTSYLVVSIQLAKRIKSDIVDRLTRSNVTYEEFNVSYFNQLILQSRSVSDNPKFAAQLSTGDKATVQQGLDETNRINGFNSDIFVALSPSGEVLAYVGTEMRSNINLSQRPEISVP